MATGAPSTVHASRVDEALGARPRAQRPGEEGVEPLARVVRPRAELHRPRSRTTSSSSTPSVMAASARLKAGQCGSLTKSVTAPSRTRSTTLPAAPPTSIPVGSQTSGRSAWRTKKTSSAPTATAITSATTGRRPASAPKATPSLLTPHEVDAGDEVAPLAHREVARARAPWSAGRGRRTTSAVSAASAQPRARERARTASAPDEARRRSRPRSAATRIATIGLRSSGPIGRDEAPEDAQVRLADVAQEPDASRSTTRA